MRSKKLNIYHQRNNGPEYLYQRVPQKRLLPLIRKHRVPTVFWPDLVSIHYSVDIIKFMNDNNNDFNSKDMNPAAVPEDRKIETYWALVKRELKKEPKAAKDDKDFKYRWKRASFRVSESTVEALMANVREKVKARSKLTKI